MTALSSGCTQTDFLPCACVRVCVQVTVNGKAVPNHKGIPPPPDVREGLPGTVFVHGGDVLRFGQCETEFTCVLCCVVFVLLGDANQFGCRHSTTHVCCC